MSAVRFQNLNRLHITEKNRAVGKAASLRQGLSRQEKLLVV